ncbi:MAG: hypothetical protein K6F07_03850 [Bacilli bacterium]|nr:hypothetical protein [Bacilli bacterium]
MILIVGSHHDDVLYFESKLRNKKEELLFNQFPFVTGTMFSQNIGIVYGGYTNYMNALLVEHIIAKNYVVLVINVGKCSSISDEYNTGDIAVLRRIYLGEVNQIGVEGSSLGQIPKCPQYFTSDQYVLDLLTNAFNRTKNIKAINSTFISMEKNVEKSEELQGISINGIFYGINKQLVLDSAAGGAALACYLNEIPFIAAKVIEKKVGDKSTIDGYVRLLKKYSDLGKAVTSFIGEISRNEVIIGEEKRPE